MHDRPPGRPGDRPGRTEFTFFITVTGCASSNKLPSFKVVDGRLPPGTKLFDFAGSSGLVNGVPTTMAPPQAGPGTLADRLVEILHGRFITAGPNEHVASTASG